MRSLDFFEQVAAAITPDEVVALLAKQATACGFGTFALGSPPRDGELAAFWYSNWPQDWLDLYAREGFAVHDPVPRAAATLVAPVSWADLRDGATGSVLTAEALRVMDAGAGFGFRGGLVVPIHGPGASLAVASFAGPDKQLARSEMATLHMAAFYAHDRLLALHRRADKPGSPLSQREAEALEWVLAGLGDDAIAAKMCVSARTARFHVDNARMKLGCRTRAQAAAAALAQGLLRP